MAKILTDKEIGDIIKKTIDEDLIDDALTYRKFLTDLAFVVSDYFGGHINLVSDPLSNCSSEDDGRYCVSYSWNEEVPSDGGIYKDYDTDIEIDADGKWE
jgi:hypothetical protein